MPEIVPDTRVNVSDDKDKKAQEFFEKRLTMFDKPIRWDVVPYGNQNNIDKLKSLYDIWTFGDQIDIVQQQLEDTEPRESEIEMIRQVLERNGL